MIYLPDGTVSRTLQEQVGYNAKKITEIIEALNESDIVDKVINLTDTSGTLSSSDAEIAEIWPAYIVYGDLIFIKVLDDGTNIDFYEINVESSTDSGSLVLSKQLFRVVKSNYAYSLTSVSIIDLSAIEGAVGITGDVSVSGAVEATTLNQTSANYELDLASIIQSASEYSTYLQSDSFYSCFKVINGVLYFILSGNATTQTVSSTNWSITLTMPDDFISAYYDKLYRADGTALTEASTSSYYYRFLAADKGFLYTGSIATCTAFINTESTANDVLTLVLFGMPAVSSGGVIGIDVRIPIMLL